MLNFLTDNLTTILSVTAILVSTTTFFLQFRKQKKLNAETEWHKVLATDFLECANEFNQLVSKIVVGASLLYGQKKYDDLAEVKKQKNEEIRIFIDQITFYEWELRKYGQFAPEGSEKFNEAVSELFDSLSKLIEPKNSPFDLEKIRKSQFEFTKKSRDLHAELLGL